MYSTVLLTLDGSKLSEGAIPHAAELAKGSDTKVVVLQVIDDLAHLRMRSVGEAYEAEESPEEYAESLHFVLRRDAEHHLTAAADTLRSAGVENVDTEIREGLPGNVIVDTARELGAGAVVMATRGHSGLGREVVGSVAEYVLRHAGEVAVVMVGTRAPGG